MRHLKVFSASWCAPCKAMAPALEQLASQGVTIEKIDVDEHKEYTARQGVRTVPTIKLFDGDLVLETMVGAMSLKQLQEFVKS